MQRNDGQVRPGYGSPCTHLLGHLPQVDSGHNISQLFSALLKGGKGEFSPLIPSPEARMLQKERPPAGKGEAWSCWDCVKAQEPEGPEEKRLSADASKLASFPVVVGLWL